MFLFHVILLSVVLVTLGYLCSWTAMHENTAKGLSTFGKIMATILYIFAAMILMFGLSYGRHCCSYMGMMQGKCEMSGQMDKMHCSMDKSGMHGMKNMPEMIGAKDEMMGEMKKWKMNNPKEWKECVDALNKPASGK